MRVLKDLLDYGKRKIFSKRAVYTCMFGHSEQFSDRDFAPKSNVDYICFTDDDSLRSEKWMFRYVDPSEFGPQKTSKLVKTCPHIFLPDYSSSLYVDNTVRINAAIDVIWDCLGHNDTFVIYRHPFWNCPYIETNKVIESLYADPLILRSQIEEYRRSGLPEHSGLYHGAILLRRHNHPAVRKLGSMWFNEIKNYTYRDQVALSFLIWKESFQYSFFDGLATDDKLFLWPDFDGPRLPRGFDEDRYLELNPGIDLEGMNPRKHFLQIGQAKGYRWI